MRDLDIVVLTIEIDGTASNTGDTQSTILQSTPMTVYHINRGRAGCFIEGPMGYRLYRSGENTRDTEMDRDPSYQRGGEGKAVCLFIICIVITQSL